MAVVSIYNYVLHFWNIYANLWITSSKIFSRDVGIFKMKRLIYRIHDFVGNFPSRFTYRTWLGHNSPQLWTYSVRQLLLLLSAVNCLHYIGTVSNKPFSEACLVAAIRSSDLLIVTSVIYPRPSKLQRRLQVERCISACAESACSVAERQSALNLLYYRGCDETAPPHRSRDVNHAQGAVVQRVDSTMSDLCC